MLFSWPCCEPSPAACVHHPGRKNLGGGDGVEGGARACGGDKPLPEGEESSFPMGHPPHRRVENSLEKSGLSGVWEVPNWKKMVVEVMGWGGE